MHTVLMTIVERISFLWDKAYTDALGAGESDPFAHADRVVAGLTAHLHRVERQQAYGNNHPRLGSRAGRRQAAERR